ncbi:MAG: nucleotidyltransferase family protein [Pseudomonadota bacterium]
MNQVPETAMLLAAGLGSRMRPLTNNTAKPLLQVADLPIIDYLMNALADAGVQRMIVNVHWCADQVERHVKAFGRLDCEVSDERNQLLETGGGLAKARPMLGDDPIFVLNTDAFWAPCDITPLRSLAEAFDPKRMDELLLLADTKRCLGFPGPGDFFRRNDGQLERRGQQVSAPWAYAGARILKPMLYDETPVEPFSANRIWDRVLSEDRLFGLTMDRFWLHIGDPKAMADAEMWMRCHGA